MLNNKWMVACLLIGSILAVAMVGSIPMYADSVLEEMIHEDLYAYQEQSEDKNYYPAYAGKYLVRRQFAASAESGAEEIEQTSARIAGYVRQLGLDTLSHTTHLVVNSVTLVPDEKSFASVNKMTEFHAFSGLNDNIELLYGRLPSSVVTDGVLEVVISRAAERGMDLIMGDTLTVKGTPLGSAIKAVRVVGVFNYKDNRNGYWYGSTSALDKAFVADYDAMTTYCVEREMCVRRVEWMYALRYAQIDLGNIGAVLGTYSYQITEMTKAGNLTFDIPAYNVLVQYVSRETELNIMLLVLQIPILIMLAFYIYMVSKLIVEFDKNEISVLKSRGCRRGQIFTLYLLQSGVISLIALLIGPFLARAACGVLGSSDGFLSFGGAPIRPAVHLKALLYCLAAAVLGVVTMLVPVVSASRTDIVILKRKKARGSGKPLWKKLYLDFILIAVSCYGIYVYGTRQNSVSAGAGSTPIEPLLYLISSLFTLGVALLMLRFYPYLVNSVFKAGEKRWSPVMYSTLTTVARQKGREQFLVIFLIFTITFGLFSASAARTIDKTMVNNVNYYYGAEYSVRGMWYDLTGGVTSGEPANDSTQGYQPLNMEKYTSVNGLYNATKVFRRYGVKLWVGSTFNITADLIATEPAKIYKTLNMPTDTQRTVTTKELCDALAADDHGTLISRAMANAYGLRVGDTFEYTYGSLMKQKLNVVGIFDYWPQYDPLSANNILMIINYDTLAGLANFRLMPYEIWYSRDKSVSTDEIRASFKELGLTLVWEKDAVAELQQRANDVKFRGTNGALTLGFIVIMVVSVMGFIIYWVLSIKSRVLQFGVLRAMGLTGGKVMRMLIGEQIFLSGFAIDVGIVLGTAVSRLFVPLIQLAYTNPTPPQSVLLLAGDYGRLFICIGLMLGVGLSVIGWLISRINVTAAIKLGEE